MKNSFKKHLRSFILVKNSPRHSAGDLGDDRLPPLLDSKMYQMYQTGTSNNPVFMRSGGFQRKFKSPFRYSYRAPEMLINTAFPGFFFIFE